MKSTVPRSANDERLLLLDRVAINDRIPRALRFIARLEATPRRWSNGQMDRMDAWTQDFVDRTDARIEASKQRDAERMGNFLLKVRELKEGQPVAVTTDAEELPLHPSAEEAVVAQLPELPKE